MTINERLHYLEQENKFLIERIKELQDLSKKLNPNPHSKLGFGIGYYWENIEKIFDSISKTWKPYAIYKD